MVGLCMASYIPIVMIRIIYIYSKLFCSFVFFWRGGLRFSNPKLGKACPKLLGECPKANKW